MKKGVVLITGSAGLVGSESVSFFIDKGFDIIGIDNNMREYFFGKDASTKWNRNRLINKYKKQYTHYSIDIRDYKGIENLIKKYTPDIIIHTAAQPSHDWAAREPFTDFSINATGTLNLLEAFRKHSPDSVFVFTSTNKVYGDRPNTLPLIEQEKRYELPENHPYYDGIDETMSIDQSLHSLFGASKVAADILVQEYGRYFGLKTAVFRGGCLTGPTHSGTVLHGFLSYLVRAAIMKKTYHIFGYKGKQVRDNIHSYDLVNAFYHFYLSPRIGEVYNMGGSRFSNCSILEGIDIVQEITGEKMDYVYENKNRKGDHIWYISSVKKFKEHYPDWDYKYGIRDIITQIYDFQKDLIIKK